VVTLTGSGFTDISSNKCLFGSASVAATYVSPTTVTCDSPASSTPTTSSTVSLEFTANDKDFTTFGNTFQYVKSMQITSSIPTFGAVSGGTQVTVYGYNFEDRESLKCKFGTVEVDATYLASTSITCDAPAGVVGTVDVELSMNGGVDYTVSSNVKFDFVPDITVSTISPESGPSTGGTSVTVSGTNFIFSKDLKCRFGSSDVSATFVSASSIVCISPPTTVSSVEVSISNNGLDFVKAASAFSFNNAPAVTSVSPSKGSVSGGTVVTLTGSGFTDISSNKCLFGSASVAATYVSPTTVTCDSPASSTPTTSSTVSLEFASNEIDYSITGEPFQYILEPTIVAVSPQIILGNQEAATVALSGYNFVDSDTLKCMVNGIMFEGSFVSSTKIECELELASLSTGFNRVHLSINDGDKVANSFADLTLVPSISVTSVSPTLATTSGTTLTISGTNFTSSVSTSAFRCLFGSTIETRASVVDSSTITCKSPQGMFSSVPVGVLHSGDHIESTGFTYSTLPDMTVGTLSPTLGSMALVSSVSVELSAGSLDSDASYVCAFGPENDRALFTAAAVVNSTHATCDTPSSPSRSLISTSQVSSEQPFLTEVSLHHASSVDFAANTGSSFVFTSAVEVTHIHPSSISLSTNDPVIAISGKNFFSSPSLTCSFGDKKVAARFVSSYRVECSLPSDVDPGSVPVEVSNNGVDFSTSSLPLSILPLSTIVSVFPLQGPPSGGTTVTITGTAFRNAASLGCKFGLQTWTDATYVSSNVVTCDSPAKGDDSEDASLGLTVCYGSAECAEGELLEFGYTSGIAVVGMEPTVGPRSGGTVVTVTSSISLDDGVSVCKFGDSVVVPTSFPTSHSMTCVSPAGESNVDFSISSNSVDFSASQQQFSYHHQVLVTGISPAHIPESGGTLQVFGSNFMNVPSIACILGEDSVTAKFVSSTEIQCDVPNLQPQSLKVSVGNSNADLVEMGSELHIEQIATLSSLEPYSGPASGGNVVTLMGTNFAPSGKMTCRFGSSVVNAHYVAPGIIECVAPASVDGEGEVEVAVSRNEVDYSTSVVKYKYIPSVFISGVHSKLLERKLGASSSVTVSGTNFDLLGETPNLECVLSDDNGGDVTRGVALVTSDVEVVCEFSLSVPTKQQSPSKFSLTDGATTVASLPRAITFTEEIYVSEIHPAYAVSDESGEAATVIVEGENFFNSPNLSCFFGNLKSPATAFISANRIQCDVPYQVPQKVAVAVSNTGGEDFSNELVFEYLKLATLSSIAPSSSSVDGGGVVTVTGTNFKKSAGLACIFGHERVYARYVSSNTLECLVPQSNVAGLVAFSLVGWGSYIAHEGNQAVVFEYLDASNRDLETSTIHVTTPGSLPMLVSVSPKSGPESGGTAITVAGSNFFETTGALCKFGDDSVTTPAVLHSATTMTCLSPSGLLPGTYDVEVSFDFGGTFTSFSGTSFTLYPSVYIADLEPASGPLSGGTSVRVFGTNFIFSSLLKCKIDSTVIDAVYISSKEVICVSPRQQSAKSLTISVSNNNVDYSESSVTFEYVPPVSVSDVIPKNGPISGGTAVTVTGSNFGSTAASVICKFGSESAHGIVLSETEITCNSPSAYTLGGTVGFSLVTNDGKVHSVNEEFTYHGEIETFQVSPNSGPSNVGQQVAVSGANFFNSPSLCCSLNGVVMPAVSFVSAQKVLCTIGTDIVPSTYDIKVSNNCQDFSSSALSYTVTEVAKVFSVSPSKGSVHGGTVVTVSGSNFVHSGKLKCHFGDSLTSDARYVFSAQLECVAPASNLIEGQFDFALSSMGGNIFGQGQVTFEYAKEVLHVTGLSPLSGNVFGGTTVTVTVSGADNRSVTFCKFGDDVVPVKGYPSSDSVACVSPTRSDTSALTVAVDISGDGADYSRDGNFFEYAASPIVSGISPSSGSQAGGTIITVTGRNFTPTASASCRFGTSSSTSATYVSSTLVTCPSPENLQPGDHKLQVSWNEGVELSSTPDNSDYVTFTSYSEAKIMSVFPTLGSNTGGTSVTISGSSFFFSPLLKCIFEGVGVSPATFISSTSVSCASPKRTDVASSNSLSVEVRISMNGVDFSPTFASFSYTPPPLISSIFPLKGPVIGGTQVTVSGSGFVVNADALCQFGGEAVNAVVVSSNLVSCIAPTHVEASVPVRVSMNSGVDYSGSGASFQFRSALHVKSIVPPNSLVDGGSMVTVLGSNFVNTKDLACRFGSLLSPSVVYVSSTQISCEVPSAAAPHSSTLEVSNNGQDFTQDSVAFAFHGHPSVSMIAPSVGVKEGGTLVVITGSYFTFTDRIACKFGFKVVSATFIDSTTLECIAPAHEDLQDGLVVALEVSNNGLDFTESSVNFEYIDSPIVSSLSPNIGLVEGVDVVTVSGSNFAKSGQAWCRFVGVKKAVAATATVLGTILSDHDITCVTPARMDESVDEYYLEVSVNNADFSSSMRILTYRPKPSIETVFPTDGSTLGSTSVTVTGSHFYQSSKIKCRFGDGLDVNELVSGRYISSSSIHCETGDLQLASSAVTTSRPVYVSFNGADFVYTGFKFNFNVPHTITSAHPTNGPVDGGTAVTISGTNFVQSQYILCKFGEFETTPGRFLSSSKILCATPVHPSGLAEVKVSMNGEDFVGGASGYAVEFSFEVGVTMAGVSPVVGHFEGGTVVTVTGTNFVDSGANLKCMFGSVPSPATFVSSNEITCITPESLNNKLQGLNSESVDVKVTTNGDDYSESKKFTYVKMPTVANVAPEIVTENTGGVKLLVSGSNFHDSSDLMCAFGGSAALTEAKWLSSSLLQCSTPSTLIPSSISSSVEVYITSNGGKDLSMTSAKLEIVTKDVGVSLSPVYGRSDGDTAVTVTGNSWSTTAESACLFGSVKMPMLTDSTVARSGICRSPRHEEGTVKVQITNNGITWAEVGDFEFKPSPSVASLSPVLGDISGGTAVTIVGMNLENTVGCRFGGEPGDATVDVVTASTNEVVCVSPAMTVRGDFDDGYRVVELVNSAGDITSNEALFLYHDMVSVVHIYPRSGPATGNSVVLVHGRNFLDTPTLRCKFGDKVVRARWLSGSQIACTTSFSDVVGDVDVRVSLNGVDFSVETAGYKFDAPIQVESLTPSFGPILGGTIVRVLANNVRYTGAVGCRFGEVFVTATFLSNKVIECVSPPRGAVGSVQVDITLNGVDYDSIVVGSATFTYVPTPEVLSIAPRTGWRDGGVELTVSARNLVASGLGSLKCNFGGRYGSVRTPISSADESLGVVKCPTPPQKQPDSEVTDLDDSVGVSLVYSSSPRSHEVSGALFTYLDAMLVDRIVPMSGSHLGGTEVHVHGENFVNDKDLVCVFSPLSGATPLETEASYISNTIIVCNSPPYFSTGAATVTVASTDDRVRTFRSMGKFTYFNQPHVERVVPDWGARSGGTVVTVTGDGFGRRFDGDVNAADKVVNHQLLCRFGNNTHPTQGRYISEQQVACKTPMASGDVGTGTVVFVEISMNGGYDWTDSGVEFTYTQKIRLNEVAPAFGSVEGGTSVSISGTGLDQTIVDQSDGYLWCHFGEEVVAGSFVSVDGGLSYDVSCEVPAARNGREGSVTVEVSFGPTKSDRTDSKALFQYVYDPIVSSVYPVSGLLEGGDVVFFEGARFTNVDSLVCRFGGVDVTAIWMNAGRVKCLTPAWSGNVDEAVPIQISLNGADFVHSGFDFVFRGTPVVLSASPSTVEAAGGTSVTLTGVNLGAVTACRFGEYGSRSRVSVTDDATVVCAAPRLPIHSSMEGSGVSLSLSTGGAFFDSGITLTYSNFKTDASLYAETLIDPVEGDEIPKVTTVYPASVSSQVSEHVNVYGEFFSNRAGLGCIFGQTFVDAIYISSKEIKCRTPIRAPGVVTFEVVQGGPSGYLSVDNVKFTFTADVSIAMAVPSHGPVGGGTVISLIGSNMVENTIVEAQSDSQNVVLCRFGTVQVRALSFSNNEIKCASPPALDLFNAGAVRLDVSSNNGTTWSRSYVPYVYEREVQVHNLSPSRGIVDGGTQVLVEGYRFKNSTSLKCKFGESVVQAVYLNPSELFCTAPPRTSGVVEVEVSTNGFDFSWTMVQYEYYDKLAVSDIWPTLGGGLIGNTVVSVFGSGFKRELGMACRFGQVVVPAKVVEEDGSSLVCASPPHLPGLVSFTVLRDAYNGNKETATGQHQFLYVNEPSVLRTVPEEGKVDGGNPVFVVGTNFVNTTALGCKFGNLVSRATIISKNSLVCIAPSVPSDRTVSVTVTLNGLDYTSSGVSYKFKEMCKKGHYCGPSASSYNLPAPNGTYVPVANAVNFTLCEPGTFQPRRGMSSCLACPVGYICPDFGLSKPVICPAGMICDEMGLRTAVTPCVEGYYCKQGTKTNDIDSFSGGDWSTDVETGLVTVDASQRTWSFIKRESPATGQRRIDHPPLNDGVLTAERPFTCPVGHYCRSGVATPDPSPFNFSTPQECFDGFFCPRGSKHPQGSGACPTGYFCPSQTKAVICPEGHYCPGVGNVRPVECYPGTHNPLLGQSNCTLCSTGNICPGWGRTHPEKCPAGFVCASLGLSVPAILCPAGYYCEEGTMTLDPSDPLIQGPKACSAGVFCLGGVAHNLTIDWVPGLKTGISAPQTCTEGSYCQPASVSAAGSGPCFPGHYCKPGSVYPEKVPLGNFASRPGSVASTLCFPGSYAPLTAMEECRSCPAGFTCQGYGTYEPRICEAGTFRSKADSVTCRLCPAGTFSPYQGATDISQCLPCPEGRVCGMQGMTNMAFSVSCPGGYTCGAGTNRANQFKHKCPAGYYCEPNTIPSRQFDLTCEKGHYCLRGTPLYLATRNKCNVRFFCPPGTSAPDSPLTKCPKRTVSLTGASSLKECLIEEVDVCDKGILPYVGDSNPFEDKSYYPKHSYKLLSYDEKLYSEPPTVEFNSGREKNPTGEVEVLRKIIPVNESSSVDYYKNDTVEVFRTCTPYGLEDDEDEVIITGRNFRESELLTCRFTACLQADWGLSGEIKSSYKDEYYYNMPRYCRNFDGTPSKDIGKRKVIVRARYISPTRVACKMPRYAFNMTGGYSWMDTHNPFQQVTRKDIQGNDYEYMGSFVDEEGNPNLLVEGGDPYQDYFDVEGDLYDSPMKEVEFDPSTYTTQDPNHPGVTVPGNPNPGPLGFTPRLSGFDFHGKCKTDVNGSIYYLQQCTGTEVKEGTCHYRGSDGKWYGDYVDLVGRVKFNADDPDKQIPSPYAPPTNDNFRHKRLYSLIIDCTQGEILDGYCDNVPEPGKRLNPCMTAQVMVEVSNNGQKFSFDDLVYNHTVESDNPENKGVPQNGASSIKGLLVKGTFTTYTYISKEKSEGTLLLQSSENSMENFKKVQATDRLVCERSLYSEEGRRNREVGWFEFPHLNYARLSFDFRNIPSEMVYNEHYKIAIYASPSRCLNEFCNPLTRMRMPAEEVLPCIQPMDMPKWFLESPSKNQIMNMTMLSMEDSIFKVEIHIVHGSFVASSDFFRNTLTVDVTKPQRAVVEMGEQLLVGKDGILGTDELGRKRVRRRSPFISWEETMIHTNMIFGILYSKEMGDGISYPLNMPPRFQDYERGRILVSMNTTEDSRDRTPTVLDEFESVQITSTWWETSNVFSTPNEAKEAVDTYFETFHNVDYSEPAGDVYDSYSFGDFENIVLPYLPFFSNCREFDSYIPFWALLEDGVACGMQDPTADRGDADVQTYWGSTGREDIPSLPHQDQVVVVNWWDVGQSPVSDECLRTVYCDYEEKLDTPDYYPRWFETTSGDEIFSILQFPIDFTIFTGRAETRVGNEDNAIKRVGEFLVSSDNERGVGINRDGAEEALEGEICLIMCYPRAMHMTIMYYQINKIEKNIIEVELDLGEEFDVDPTRTDYSVTFEFFPLNWMDLIVKFAFDTSVFAVLFVSIGVITIVITVAFWITIRFTTQLESPPRLRFTGMLSLVCPPAFTGFGLGMLPIFMVTIASTALLRGYKLFPAFFDFTPLQTDSTLFGSTYQDGGSNWAIFGPEPTNSDGTSDDDGRESLWRQMHWMDPKVDPGRIVEAQNGRMGLAFLIMGAMCIFEGAHIFLPQRVSKREKQMEMKRDKNADKDSIWIPTVWKRSNLIYTSVMMVMFLTFIVEFSYWGEFGNYIWWVILILKIVAQFVGQVVDNQLNEALLSAPVNTSLGLVQGMVTLSADDFKDFLFSYLVEFGFLLLERVYIDPGLGDFLDFVDEQWGLLYERILRRMPKWLTGRLLAAKKEEEEAEKTERQKEIENMVQDGAETVEPILDSYGSYCCDTMSLLYTIFNIFLLMMYRDETVIPDLYGIKEKDMFYYLLFAVMIVPFQLVADILIHSCLELYHGWKIYDYLVYTRYRFLQRETRWKGLEDSLDECIEESMRTMDQMCFSSQFYMMMTIHVNGIMYMVLAIEMMIRAQYNMFGDPAFYIVTIFVMGFCLGTKHFLIWAALKVNLWRIKHENTAWHTTVEDDDEFDIPGWDDMKGASHDAYLMNQRITSETFRYKFLNYNRAWIINQLPTILTPRTLRRSRPYLINQFTRILNAMNQDISSDSDMDDGPKFGIPILNAPTRKLLRWWLNQAQRRLKLREVVQPLINRARGTQCEQCLSRKLLQVELVIPIEELDERFQAEHPNEEFDQILWKNFWQKHAQYRTICLNCISQRKERERREALAGQLKDEDDEDGADYPANWGAVYLNAASNAILLGWYKAAQNRLFGKDSGAKRRARALIPVSDDEGDELTQAWAQEALTLSESSKLIAIKWLRTARAKIQKDKGFEGGMTRTRRARPGDKYKSGKKSKTRRK